MDQKIDIGRVIGRGFQALGGNFAAFLPLSLLLGGLPTLAMQFLFFQDLSGTDPAAVFVSPYYWASIPVSLITGYLLQALIVRSTILSLGGEPSDPGGSLALAVKLILPMIGIGILSWIVVTIGTLLLIVPGVIAYLMLIVAVPVLVEERRGVIDSMKRSAELTKGSKGQIFLLVLLFAVAWFSVSTVIGVVFGASTAVWYDSFATTGAAMQALTGALVTLLSSVMTASLYIELRAVKEGAASDSLATIFA